MAECRETARINCSGSAPNARMPSRMPHVEIRNVARANVEPIFAIQETKGCKGIAVIQKRFSLTHDNHIAHAGAHIVLSDQYLLDNLSGKQIARESLFACGAERARHRATDLRRTHTVRRSPDGMATISAVQPSAYRTMYFLVPSQETCRSSISAQYSGAASASFARMSFERFVISSYEVAPF